ncbi:MAG: hypothetical protein H0X08_06680 [Blastocatellia bacterium]|nr:hypothetical protein [Blastocatellia bacterium]
MSSSTTQPVNVTMTYDNALRPATYEHLALLGIFGDLGNRWWTSGSSRSVGPRIVQVVAQCWDAATR